MRPVLGSFNLVTVTRAHVYPLHQHFNYELIFAKRGTYRCRVNEVEIVLRPRDVLIVKRGDWHEDHCSKGLRYLAVDFEFAGSGEAHAEDILFSRDVGPAQQIVRGPNAEIWQILDRMAGESQSDDHVVAHIENALLLELFWTLVRSLPHEHLSPVFLQRSAAQAFSDRLRRLFDGHLGENLSTGAIAKKLGMSVRTLTKRCQEVVGRPPGRAFMQNKMDHAARALRHSDVPIKELSHRLGFQNQYHFSRVFRRYLGVPPSSYRRMP